MKAVYRTKPLQSTASPPNFRHLDFDSIPDELKKHARWVNWQLVERHGKRTKLPINPGSGEPASCADPSTWGTYDQAIARFERGRADGIGFQLGAGYVGIDLDKCRSPETGAIEAWAQQIIDELNSYTEISPSGRGVHILAKGSLPAGPRRRGQVEMYSSGRYLTVTGHHLVGTPKSIEERSSELKSAHAQQLSGRHAKTNARGGNPSSSDTELIETAQRAANGAKFDCLWRGDFSDYESGSEADLALCSMLAFWTGRDANRIDRLFRQSGLYRPKWDERRSADGRTYGQITVDKATQQTLEVWSPDGEGAVGPKAKGVDRRLPVILVNDRQLREVTDDALKALDAANVPPALFVRAGNLVRIRRDETCHAAIEVVTEGLLRARLAEISNTVRLTKNAGFRDCFPPSQ